MKLRRMVKVHINPNKTFKKSFSLTIHLNKHSQHRSFLFPVYNVMGVHKAFNISLMAQITFN